MDNREIWLATTLIELADTGDAHFGEATCCRLLAMRLAQLLAPADTGVLIADAAGRLEAAAASSARAYSLESLAADNATGPATDCYGSGRPVLNEPLTAAGGRWPRYTAAARTCGYGVVSALPMRRHDETVGVIEVLAAAGRRLDETEIRLAQALAEAAAVAIMQHRTLHRSSQLAEQLQHALDSRVIIEQAKGALAARLDIAPEAAFGLLRGFARRHSRPLADVCAAVIRGELTTEELLASSGTRRRSPRQ